MARALGIGLVLLAAWACASTGGPEPAGDTYLKRVAFEMPGHEYVLLHWGLERMPLRVHLPDPPEGLFEDPEAIRDSVRDGVTDWSDVAAPGVPRFVFVDSAGEADIPIVWSETPDGAWFIAHCAYDIDARQRRFGVMRILVTGRWGGGRVADLHDIYNVMLHEMGHALGMGGHSDEPRDIMYPGLNPAQTGLTLRDRATLAALYSRPRGTHVPGARRER